MSVTLKVSVQEMETAANRCKNLAQELERCLQECQKMNEQLQGMWEGAAATQFDQYVRGTATPALKSCVDMCYQTADGISQTCQQFAEADSSLSRAFKV